MRRIKKRKRIRRPVLSRVCHFCETKTVPLYRNADVLKRFTSERGKVYSHSRSGACSRHQRKLTREIKRARHIALLPFVTA